MKTYKPSQYDIARLFPYVTLHKEGPYKGEMSSACNSLKSAKKQAKENNEEVRRVL